MNRLAVKGEPDWIRFHAQWKQSGLTQKKFCEQQGVSYHLFRCRYSELKRIERESVELSSCIHQGEFVPVTVEVEEAVPPRCSQSDSVGAISPEVEVELPFGVILRFRGFVAK